MEKLELADKILEYIDTHDICKGDYVTSNGAACLLGAGRLIQIGLSEEWFKRNPDGTDVIEADLNTAEALGFNETYEVVDFNDESTKGQIIEHIRKMCEKWFNEMLRREGVDA